MNLRITTWLPDTWALLTRWWPDLSNLRVSWPMTKFPVHICCPLAYRIHTRAMARHIGAKLAAFQSPYAVWVRHVHHWLAKLGLVLGWLLLFCAMGMSASYEINKVRKAGKKICHLSQSRPSHQRGTSWRTQVSQLWEDCSLESLLCSPCQHPPQR